MNSKTRAYIIYPAIGFILAGAYIFVTDGNKFGWDNVDLTLLTARGAGGGLFGAIVGFIIAWFSRRKNPVK
jgi:hypothetical protein